MNSPAMRSVCWKPIWNKARTGLEHLVLGTGNASSVLLALDDEGRPIDVSYRLRWDNGWQLREALVTVRSRREERSLALTTDSTRRWYDGRGRVAELDGCAYIDIWPTPFTNTFPIRGERIPVGARREVRVAWLSAPDLSLKAQTQVYTRLELRRYLFESLDGSGFKAKLEVDTNGLVLDYPTLFKRVRHTARRRARLSPT